MFGEAEGLVMEHIDNWQEPNKRPYQRLHYLAPFVIHYIRWAIDFEMSACKVC